MTTWTRRHAGHLMLMRFLSLCFLRLGESRHQSLGLTRSLTVISLLAGAAARASNLIRPLEYA